MVMSLVNVSLLANILLVVITAYYAFLTQRLVQANKRQMNLAEKQIEYQERPYVEISAGLREGTTLFQLRIKNTGTNTAREMKLTLEPDFYRFHKKQTRTICRKCIPFRA